MKSRLAVHHSLRRGRAGTASDRQDEKGEGVGKGFLAFLEVFFLLVFLSVTRCNLNRAPFSPTPLPPLLPPNLKRGCARAAGRRVLRMGRVGALLVRFLYRDLPNLGTLDH